VDNFSVANPPSNERLLDALARDFVESGYDIRNDMRGSGAWRLKSYLRGSNYTYERNPDWYDADKVRLEGMSYPLLTDTSAQAAQFRTGALWTYPVLQDDVVALKKEEGENLPAVPGDMGVTAEFLSHVAPAQAILTGTSSFRLDRLAVYLSAKGADRYFRQYLAVDYTNVDAKCPGHNLGNVKFDAQGNAWMASDVGLLMVDGTRVTIDIYEPVARPIGVAIVAHGWTRSRARHRDAGRALAEAGVVAIIPDLPNYLDLWGNGTTIVALVGQLETGALGLPPVERSSLVLIGTSAGGLATIWAASKLPGIAGWVGLDPVDRTGTGMYAASKLAAPAIVLLGDASACNLLSSGRTLANSVQHLVRSVKIDGASHCDFEAPTNGFCSVMCGFGWYAMK